MKTETIEWFTPEERMPNHEQEVLFRLNQDDGQIWAIVHGMYYKDSGFRSMYNNEHKPACWCAIPQG